MDLFRHVANVGDKSPRIVEAAEWLRRELAAIPEGDTETTRQLIARLGMDTADPGEKKALGSALWRLRTLGLLDGCWEQDLRRRYMGNPLIMWKRPAL
jgi:hypothetical protein